MLCLKGIFIDEIFQVSVENVTLKGEETQTFREYYVGNSNIFFYVEERSTYLVRVTFLRKRIDLFRPFYHPSCPQNSKQAKSLYELYLLVVKSERLGLQFR